MSDQNSILQRFHQVRGRLRGPFSTIEAVRSRDQIVFRTGLGCALLLAGAAMGVLLWLSLVFATGFFEYPPSGLARLLIALMTLVMLVMATTFIRERRVHFAIDTSKEKILIPGALNGYRRISLGRIEFFLGCRVIGSESIQSEILAVDTEGKQYRLTDELGPGARLPETMQCLGYICHKPALLMERHEVDPVPKEKEALLRAAEVIYRPGQPDGPAG